jgi:hypothetical protein
MKPHTSLMSEPRLTRHAKKTNPPPSVTTTLARSQVDELAFRKFPLAQGSRLPLFQAPGSEIDLKSPSVPSPA